jgi:hypothetical protein
MFERLFIAHPRSVGETYGEHFVMASGFGVRLVLSGFACLVHAVFPGLFETTGSAAVKELHRRMVIDRLRRSTTLA